MSVLDRDTVRYVDGGLLRHTTYWYRLTARNSLGSAQSTALPTETGYDAVTPNAVAPEAGKTVTQYRYDALGRLAGADLDSGLFYDYTYDVAGNRLSEQTFFGTTQYAYDAAHRLTSRDGAAVTWDANGNLLSDGQASYSYDAANLSSGK